MGGYKEEGVERVLVVRPGTFGPQTLLGTKVLQLYSRKPDKKRAASSATTEAPWDLLARVCSLDEGRWEKSDTFPGTRVLREWRKRMEEHAM